MSNVIDPIIASIVTLISGVPNIGPVWPYDRRLVDPNTAPNVLKTVFGVTDTLFPHRGFRINYATVDRADADEQLDMDNSNLTVERILITLYRELYDPGLTANPASRPAHRATVEAVRDILRQTRETAAIELLYPPTILRDTDAQTGGLVRLAENYICHQTTIAVRAQAQQEVTP